MFWVKPKGYWYARYVLSQVQGISRVGLRCLSLFTSNPCPLFPRTLKKLNPEKSETFPLFSCFSYNAFLIQSPCSPAWWTWVVTWSSWSRQTTRESSSTEARPTRQTWRCFQNSSWQFADKLGAHTFILILYFHNDLVEIDPHRLPTRFWRSMGSLCITRLTRKWSTTYTM